MWKIYNALLLICIFCSCSQSSQHTFITFQGVEMTIPWKIIIGADISATAEGKVKQAILEVFSRVDRVYNKWNPESELSRINTSAGHIPIQLSQELYEFLQVCSRFVELTNGAFDPTIEYAQTAWKKALDTGDVLTTTEQQDILRYTGWNTLLFIPESKTVVKSHDQVMLDLGGIAKGFCVDVLSQKLDELGYSNYFIEWGGEIRTKGKHPENRPWRIYISKNNSMNPEHAYAVLSLGDIAVATSGDYMQNWKIQKDNQELLYTHVIHPKTCTPMIQTEQSLTSVTVCAGDCMTADVLATYLFSCSDITEAKNYFQTIQKKYHELKVWIVTRENDTVYCLE